MNNIIDINQRIEAARTARLSEIHKGRVVSDKALELISVSLRRLEWSITQKEEMKDG